MADQLFCDQYNMSMKSGGYGDTFLGGISHTNESRGNITAPCPQPNEEAGVDSRTVTLVSLYGLICVVGLFGNGLVILVISRYTKMKTVTNMYILNLSVADFLFLLGLPLVMVTAVIRQWVFGEAMCKIYFSLTCVNMFTGAFTLTLMSADRFLAVVHPISSLRWRTPRYALMAIGCLWLLSALLLLPVFLYAKVMTIDGVAHGCSIVWPEEQALAGHHAFFIYTLLLGFLIPVTLIVLLYTLLLVRLRQATRFRSGDRRRSHRKVTRLVGLVILVFIVCWLPHWAIQTHLIVRARFYKTGRLEEWQIFLITLFTLLSYANSMVSNIPSKDKTLHQCFCIFEE